MIVTSDHSLEGRRQGAAPDWIPDALINSHRTNPPVPHR